MATIMMHNPIVLKSTGFLEGEPNTFCLDIAERDYEDDEKAAPQSTVLSVFIKSVAEFDEIIKALEKGRNKRVKEAMEKVFDKEGK